MRRRWNNGLSGAAALLAGLLLFSARAAGAAPATGRLDLRAQDLAGELDLLARMTGVELLVDQSLVAHRQGRALHGVLTSDQALSALLRGSGLTFRRTADGVFVISAAEPRVIRASATPAEAAAAPVAAVAEILVVSRRSLNADVPRNPDDVQPYEIASSDVIARSQTNTAEDFLRSWLPADGVMASLIQTPLSAAGSPRSQVDLRGLGTTQTLVLVDGRRLPSIPLADNLLQPDLNAIPLAAIDRIETLTSTAGGIFGPDATGGVVNVVLRHDFRGASLSATSGVTARGDAPQWRIEGAVGGALPYTGGRVLLAVSHAEDQGLDFGDRDYVQRARTLDLERTPPAINYGYPPVANDVNILSADGNPLTLIPALGGGSIGSTMTHLPVSAIGSAGEASVLSANAGSLDYSLSDDGQGLRRSLLTRTRTDSVIFDVRQPVGSRVQTYLDVLYLSDRGAAAGPQLEESPFYVLSGTSTAHSSFAAPGIGNPFQNTIVINTPVPGLTSQSRGSVVTLRGTAGVIVQLTAGWTADLDISIGRTANHTSSITFENTANGDVDPFDNFIGVYVPGTLAETKAAFPTVTQKFSDRLTDLAFRVGGPLFDAPGGPVTMSLLAELRRERNPGSVLTVSGDPTVYDNPLGAAEQVGSVYGELRVPVAPLESPILPLRGLELQLAVREDKYSITSPAIDLDNFTEQALTYATGGHATTSITAGARVFPLSGLMLRFSFADGYLLPSPGQVTPYRETYETTAEDAAAFGGYSDPRRGGTLVGVDRQVQINLFGNPGTTPERARTFSAGVVLKPPPLTGLRISVDYTRTNTSEGLSAFRESDIQYILDNQAAFGSRITREPLSPADKAGGYTGGVIDAIDASPLNVTRSVAETLDLDADYVRSTALGAFRMFGKLHWAPSLRFRPDPTGSYYETAGYSDGPLKWRGSFGLDWTGDAWSAGLAAQYDGSYRVALGAPDPVSQSQGALNELLQGASSIPSRLYVDAFVGFRSHLRLPGEAEEIDFRFGVRDLFDTLPPIVVAPADPPDGIGYSPYGDPRGRRFQLTASARF